MRSPSGQEDRQGSLVPGVHIEPGDDVRVEFTRLRQLALRFR